MQVLQSTQPLRVSCSLRSASCSCCRRTRLRQLHVRASLIESLQKIGKKIEWELNFENWAPRSSRAWRLRERPTEVSYVVEAGVLAEAEKEEWTVAADAPLTGLELAIACNKKYGKYHDMAVKHTRVTRGAARWVALNLYVGHLGQRSFPYTEEQYLEKLDAVAFMLTTWDQAQYVREFFAEPPIARRGLPSRPRVDTAVSLRLNSSPTWDESLTKGFFLEDDDESVTGNQNN